ncbi:ABC transporter substrate-binding protein [Pusillimonas noertemannii]|uniref:ABC-type nitrate/sulfonate/bicarbonate transport system substrate-binding protein n=1 Tax=Pusillimonas noertemannii TaxID=305977 RepID=A0A2U1CJT1_9BURK|nr:ABC transporter substrate-binding protein [Pusillimonas noertemannii]NYT69828.1 ABC transporter substrate-binding protein [Pusillimonas noertemannii]PVY61248.1 ABC-type nitrate/sulfonate/bicarbonate transport system substrate-binding protein [Pusillimonas noertemannii]
MRDSFKRVAAWLRYSAIVVSLGLTSTCLATEPLPQKVRLSVNPSQIIYLPLFVAVERGYFKDEGLDVEVIPYKGSANSQMPLLARGDVDISSVIAGPAMFNQFADGFNIKLISVLTQPKQGYRDGVVLMVRSDLWDSGAIRSPADLRGRKVDGAAVGNPIDFLLQSTLSSAGLDKTDVSLSYKPRTPSDTIEILRQKVVDVAGVSEPTATMIESEGIAKRWLSYKDVIPWYQETFLAASETFLSEHPDAVKQFLAGYFKAVQEITQSKGQWTAGLLSIASKWTGMPEPLLRQIGGTSYWSPDGVISIDVLQRVQDFWAQSRLVRKPVDVKEMVDISALERLRHTAQAG